MIRKAETKDIARIIELLHQVNMVHHAIRPDLFKPHTTKYNEQQLEALLSNSNSPIFVYDDRQVLGYAFCQVTEVSNNLLLQDIKTLYIDDICVDQAARGKHVGKALYKYVREYARSIGCNNITLNVWEGNDTALSFYRNMGMKVQKTTMEVILTNDNPTPDKEEQYRLLTEQISALIDGETDSIAAMANVCAAIHQTMGFFWTGFYRVQGNELLLGPFQGPVACMHIGFGRGVCGTAWQRHQTIVVPDVEQFPGHIACSSLSRSEIVVPVCSKDGTVVAVLDIDSKELSTFDNTDRHYLEHICKLLPI